MGIPVTFDFTEDNTGVLHLAVSVLINILQELLQKNVTYLFDAPLAVTVNTSGLPKYICLVLITGKDVGPMSRNVRKINLL